MVQKKHLLKQMLQYFSFVVIGATINLPLTGFPEHIILQEIQACNQSQKLETTVRWKSGSCGEFLLSLTANSRVQFVLQKS